MIKDTWKDFARGVVTLMTALPFALAGVALVSFCAKLAWIIIYWAFNII